MPFVRLNAVGTKVALHRSPCRWRPCLDRVTNGTGPVIIITHGYKYAPGAGQTCPHATLVSPCRVPVLTNSTRWLQPLGFGTGDAGEGLAVAFGWNAGG